MHLVTSRLGEDNFQCKFFSKPHLGTTFSDAVSSSALQSKAALYGRRKTSGFETVGVVLALLPLVVSAAKDYNNCIGPFTRYKHFAKETERFVELLEVQKVIFHNECEILLQGILGKDIAASMLSTPDHESWRDIDLEQSLLRLLENSSTACITVIKLINRRLQDIEVECRDLAATLNDREMRKQKHESSVSWKRRIKAKLRASFSKPRWVEIINDLRAWNGDFGILASQSFNSEAKQRPLGNKIARAAKQEIIKYNIVGKAS